MKSFATTVTITCATKEEAEQVVSERVYFDEDYGFDYNIEAGYAVELGDPDGQVEAQQEIADTQGWTERSVHDLALEFIQSDPARSAAFTEYLRARAAAENA